MSRAMTAVSILGLLRQQPSPVSTAGTGRSPVLTEYGTVQPLG
jgi:hypothetical protein